MLCSQTSSKSSSTSISSSRMDAGRSGVREKARWEATSEARATEGAATAVAVERGNERRAVRAKGRRKDMASDWAMVIVVSEDSDVAKGRKRKWECAPFLSGRCPTFRLDRSLPDNHHHHCNRMSRCAQSRLVSVVG